MAENTKKIWTGLLIALLLAAAAAFWGGVNARIIFFLLVLALIPMACLLSVEYMVLIAAFLIPLAPHTQLFDEHLPSMTLDFPFVAICGLVFLYPALKRGRSVRGVWLVAGCWAAFILLTALSWLFNGLSTYSELFAVNRFGYFVALLVLAAAVDPENFDFKKVCRAFYAAAFIVALIGLAQYIFYAYFYNDLYINAFLRNDMVPGYYNRIYDRVISTFGNPHTTGMYLGIVFMTALGGRFWGFNRRWTRLLWVVVVLSAIVLTRSRTTLICLSAGYVFIVFYYGKNNFKNIIYKLGTLAGLLVMLLYLVQTAWVTKLLNYQESLQARFMLWEAALDRFWSSPLWGTGPNLNVQVAGSVLPVPVDNFYLTVLAAYGLCGLIAILGMIYVIYCQLRHASGRSFISRNMACGIGCGLLMLLIGNLSGDFMFHTRVTGAYLLLLGCFLAVDLKKSGGPLKVLLVGNPLSLHLQRWGKSLARLGVSVHVLAPRVHPIAGCFVHEVNCKAVSVFSVEGILNLARRLWLAEQYMKEIAPDLVHIHGAFSFGWYASSYTGGPVITSVWGGDIYRYAAASRHKYWLVKSILQKAVLVTVPTEEVAGDVREKFDVNNIHVLPWGIDSDVFHPRRSEEEVAGTKEMLGIPVDAKLVLSPRMLMPVYNVEIILESMPQVLKVYDNVYFCFLRGSGSAAYEAHMVRKASNLGVKDRTRWITQMQTPEEMARLFRSADVFVSVPGSDNLGSTIIEGLACGCIPVLKRLHNYRALYDAGAVMCTVYDVNPASLAVAIISALKKRTGQSEAVNAAVAHKFGTWQGAVHKMMQLYAGLATGKPVKEEIRR